MASLERKLIRAWRKAHGLTLAELGRGVRPKRKSVARMSEVETRDNSMGVSEILEIIHAFGRAGKPIGPGSASDQIRLSIFFAGPDAVDARAAFVKAARDVVEREDGGQG